MRILLSGSSGFIGSEVFFYLKSQGNEIVRLKRGNPQDSDSHSLFWDPNLGKYQLDSFEGFDAVIHLAGEPILGLWTKTKKQQIFSSRVASTELLVKILSQTTKPPKTFISASAVGYYGNRGEEWLTENSSVGEGFLPSVCSAWEAAANNLRVRVVHTRFGVVLDKEGGMLKKMCLFFSLGLGCVLGTGEQWMSWIVRSDLVRAIAFCLSASSIEGAVNCVSPNPVRQKEFARSLAASLARPLFLRLPTWLLQGMLGDMAEEMLLASQRVKPEKLQQHNFSFQYENLEGVLTDEHRTGTRK